MLIHGTGGAILYLNDSDDTPAYAVQNIGGTFAIKDNTNSANRLTVNSSGNATFSGDLTVSGNLSVTGTTTQNNTVATSTKVFTLASGSANDAAADGGGIAVDSAAGDKTWLWVDATNAWTSSEHINVAAGKVFGFADDTDTSIDRPAANTIRFTTGNSERLRIFSNGSVGVGDFSSASLTHAFQALRTSGSTYVSSKNTGGNARFYAEASNGNTAALELMQAGTGNFTLEVGSTNALMFKDDGTERLRLDSAGRVLIGSSSNNTDDVGDSALQVHTLDDLHPAIRVNSTSNNGYTMFGDAYAADESQVNIGISHSSSSLVLSQGCKVNISTDDAYVSSQDSYATRPNVLRLDSDGSLSFHNTSSASTTPTDNAVSLTERFRILSNGNISVGSNGAAAEKFQVNGGNIAIVGGAGYKIDTHPLLTTASFTDISGGSYAARLGSTGTSTIRSTQIYGGGNHIATFDGVNYRLGINETAPDAALHISHGSAPTIRLENTDTSLTTSQVVGNIEFKAVDPSGIGANVIGSLESFSDSSVGGSYGLKFRVSTSSSANYEAMRIAQNGYVSLGGQTPDAHFHIEKLTPELRVQSTNANLGQGGTVCTYSHHTSDPTTPTGVGEVFRIKTYSANANGADYTTELVSRAGSGGGQSRIALGQGALGAITFSTHASGSATERVRIASDGSFTLTQATLNITSSAAYTTHLNYNNAGINYISMANSGGTYFRGSSNCITALTVNGAGGITVNGDITATGSIDSTSDIKLKTNIKTIDNALDKVLQLRGAEYDRIDRDNQHEIGVIAQEVEEVIPELVHGDETKTVSYGNMTAVLIEAIKEQNEIINRMRKEIEDLKN